MGNARGGQLRINPEEMRLISCSKSNGNRVLRNTAWCTLTGSMNRLGNLDPSREIGPYDDVVTEVGSSVRNLARLGRRCR